MTEEIKNENLQNNLQQNNQANNAPKSRMHSYNAGLPKNFKKKLDQKQNVNRRVQKQEQNQYTGNLGQNDQNLVVTDGQNAQITDVNSRTLNRAIGLNSKVRHNKNSLKIMFLHIFSLFWV